MGKKNSQKQSADSFFTRSLIRWHLEENSRSMPWKGILDPYRIWLSEVILQQTRVEQGWAYYERFIENFPTIKDLAEADDTKVFKCWEGLGYYSRCRNLLHTARHIQNNLKGEFPKNFEEVLALKGVGPYTAAAIVSFAYKLPHAVVDGNVMRVLARFFAYGERTDSSLAKKWFSEKATALLDKDNPDLFNQAIMDLGATVCLPKKPNCEICPLHPECQSFRQNRASEFPVKAVKPLKKNRFLFYLIARFRGSVYIRKRQDGDVWANLHEFILVDDLTKPEDVSAWISSQAPRNLFNQKVCIAEISKIYKQELTHQRIQTQFACLDLIKPWNQSEYQLLDRKTLLKLAFPRSLVQFLYDHSHWFEC